jgi:transketolase
MRRAFGKQIADLADLDPRIVLLVGDIGYKIFDDFRERHPKRFFNMGICEQSLIGVSAGMAIEGLKPWVYTITPFLIERPFEQIKLDINEQNVNVKLVGYADYPTLGPTHSEMNAKLLMTFFPKIKSYFPRDGVETISNILDAYNLTGPAFISLKSDPLLSSSITASSKM